MYIYDKVEFAHAIYRGTVMGKPAVIIGHRQGERNLLLFYEIAMYTFEK